MALHRVAEQFPAEGLVHISSLTDDYYHHDESSHSLTGGRSKKRYRLGDHCSKMERRAETAERELVKLKLLAYLSGKLGEQFDAVITGVADYGFYAQVERFPAEGLVHISSLVDDYYQFDEAGHALEGKRTRRRFRLGDRVRVEVARVDVQRRLLDFRLAGMGGRRDGESEPPPSHGQFPRGRRHRGHRRNA